MILVLKITLHQSTKNPTFTHSTTQFTFEIKDQAFLLTFIKKHTNLHLKTATSVIKTQDQNFKSSLLRSGKHPLSITMKLPKPIKEDTHSLILRILAYLLTSVKPPSTHKYHHKSTLVSHFYTDQNKARSRFPTIYISPTSSI